MRQRLHTGHPRGGAGEGHGGAGGVPRGGAGGTEGLQVPSLLAHLANFVYSFFCFFFNDGLFLTPSRPRCHLKTTHKSAKFQALKPFCLLFHAGM